MFWIGALFFSILGVSTPVWKLSLLLVSGVGIYSTYRLGKLLYDETTGRLAALFWATSLGFLYFHNDIHIDTLLADTITFSIWQLAAFFKSKKPAHFYLGMAGAGLSMLAKGPVGLAIPAFSTGFHLIMHKKWKEILHPRWIAGTLIIAILIIPALVGLLNQFGPEGIKFYFWTNNMGRITGSYAGKNNDPFFYLHTSLYVLAPFTIFALFGLGRKIAGYFREKGKVPPSFEFYTLGGIIPFFLILSVARAKNPHYLMAVIPLFMILAAAFTASFSSDRIGKKVKKVVTRLNVFMSGLFWLVIFLFVFWLFPEKNPWYWAGLAVFAGILIFFVRTYRGISRQIAMLTITILAFMFSLNASLYPAMMKYHAPIHAVNDFNLQAAPGEKIHCYLPPARYWEVFFYSKNPGNYVVTQDQLPSLVSQTKDWVFTDQKGKDQIMRESPACEIVRVYDHSSLSKITLPFLIPSTRCEKLEKRYLLHLP